ncbi:MAG: L-threonylcarbamoyladenylate synthase [Cyanobacteria bacterium SBLK]|nr:L-threonylcarbamoyladenylate synthase [Cyanobacteria bacterium SBLK]
MKVSQEKLIEVVKTGEVVSFPTDTVPALAARPDRAAAIFTLKGRSLKKPLILLGADFADLQSYIQGSATEIVAWRQITEKYWPGALTLILPASSEVPEDMNPRDRSTIGIRVPALRVAREILRQTGPLATTSANRSGESPLETANAIEDVFPQVATLEGNDFPNNVTVGSGLPSTVAKWTGKGWEILRHGSIAIEEK